MMDSDVEQCNCRLRENLELMVGGYVRDTILKLGIVSKDRADKLLKMIGDIEVTIFFTSIINKT